MYGAIPYSLNEGQFDIGMESQDCAQRSNILYSLEQSYLRHHRLCSKYIGFG